ncbi:hypothetical protein OSTOST_16995, partial [Ostertagia ostertagi]
MGSQRHHKLFHNSHLNTFKHTNYSRLGFSQLLHVSCSGRLEATMDNVMDNVLDQHSGKRAKVSYEYWKYFMTEGRRKLADYNKDNGTRITIMKEHVLRVADENNLGLLLRQKITKLYEAAKLKIPVMSVKKGKIFIGREI